MTEPSIRELLERIYNFAWIDWVETGHAPSHSRYDESHAALARLAEAVEHVHAILHEHADTFDEFGMTWCSRCNKKYPCPSRSGAEALVGILGSRISTK